jgi:hypothetical protein
MVVKVWLFWYTMPLFGTVHRARVLLLDRGQFSRFSVLEAGKGALLSSTTGSVPQN